MRVAILTSLTLALAALLVTASTAAAKRRAPAEVAPVIHQGVRYTAPTGRMGWVEARDETGDTLLWEVRVYIVTYDPAKEQDVQDVYITELRLEGGELVVRDEREHEWIADLATHEARRR